MSKHVGEVNDGNFEQVVLQSKTPVSVTAFKEYRL